MDGLELQAVRRWFGFRRGWIEEEGNQQFSYFSRLRQVFRFWEPRWKNAMGQEDSLSTEKLEKAELATFRWGWRTTDWRGQREGSVLPSLSTHDQIEIASGNHHLKRWSKQILEHSDPSFPNLSLSLPALASSRPVSPSPLLPFQPNRFTAIDLLEKLLKFDPTARISADEALRHPYFTTSAAVSGQQQGGQQQQQSSQAYQQQAQREQQQRAAQQAQQQVSICASASFRWECESEVDGDVGDEVCEMRTGTGKGDVSWPLGSPPFLCLDRHQL